MWGRGDFYAEAGGTKCGGFFEMRGIHSRSYLKCRGQGNVEADYGGFKKIKINFPGFNLKLFTMYFSILVITKILKYVGFFLVFSKKIPEFF